MKPTQAPLSPRRTNIALATLFSAMFVLGTAELLVVGMLNLITDDLAISAPTAGTLVTANALGLAIGGPILTALTIKMNKRTILVGVLVLFVLANLVPVLRPDYGLFVAARTIAGALQGLFIGVGFMAGISIVPPERMGRAISTIVSGVAVSAAVGVPLGTLLGQELGWRGSFVAVVVLATIAAIVTAAVIPSMPSSGGGAAGQAKYAFAPRVLAVLALSMVAFTSLFSALTYIVPFLESVTGISGALISVFLFAYGAATAVGSFAGGRFADSNASTALVVATMGTAGALLALCVVGSIAILVAVALLIWGVFAYGMVPSLQYRAVELAGPGGQLASSLPASAANVGIALGPIVGGVAIDSFSPSAPMIAGLIVAILAIPVAWGTSFLKPPPVEDAAQAGPVAEPVPAST